MNYSKSDRQYVLEKSGGRCNYCRKNLRLGAHGLSQDQGGWHVDHSRPRSGGGSQHRNNLVAACVRCNLRKGARPSSFARAMNGLSAAPLSHARQTRVRLRNSIIGALVGGLLGGPAIVVGACAAIGALLEPDPDPRKLYFGLKKLQDGGAR